MPRSSGMVGAGAGAGASVCLRFRAAGGAGAARWWCPAPRDGEVDKKAAACEARQPSAQASTTKPWYSRAFICFAYRSACKKRGARCGNVLLRSSVAQAPKKTTRKYPRDFCLVRRKTRSSVGESSRLCADQNKHATEREEHSSARKGHIFEGGLATQSSATNSKKPLRDGDGFSLLVTPTSEVESLKN